MKMQIFLAVIGSGLLNVFCSSLFYSAKLRKELKFSRNNNIASKIEESLELTRNLVYKILEQEIYGIDELLNDEEGLDNFTSDYFIYQSIFNDWSSFNEFMDYISECREKYERYLNTKISVNLAFIEKYAMNASKFISENGNERYIRFWGVLLSIDLREWACYFDKILIKELNKHTYKLEFNSPQKWSRIKKRELTQRYDNSILKYLQTGELPKKLRWKVQLVDEYISQLNFENNNHE